MRRPTPRPHGTLVVATVLVALLLAGALQASDAHLWVVWRTALLSWDSPTSQLADALALQGAIHADGARRAREATLAAFRPAGLLRLPIRPALTRSAALSSRLTRAPPAA